MEWNISIIVCLKKCHTLDCFCVAVLAFGFFPSSFQFICAIKLVQMFVCPNMFHSDLRVSMHCMHKTIFSLIVKYIIVSTTLHWPNFIKFNWHLYYNFICFVKSPVVHLFNEWISYLNSNPLIFYLVQRKEKMLEKGLEQIDDKRVFSRLCYLFYFVPI